MSSAPSPRLNRDDRQTCTSATRSSWSAPPPGGNRFLRFSTCTSKTPTPRTNGPCEPERPVSSGPLTHRTAIGEPCSGTASATFTRWLTHFETAAEVGGSRRKSAQLWTRGSRYPLFQPGPDPIRPGCTGPIPESGIGMSRGARRRRRARLLRVTQELIGRFLMGSSATGASGNLPNATSGQGNLHDYGSDIYTEADKQEGKYRIREIQGESDDDYISVWRFGTGADPRRWV